METTSLCKLSCLTILGGM